MFSSSEDYNATLIPYQTTFFGLNDDEQASLPRSLIESVTVLIYLYRLTAPCRAYGVLLISVALFWKVVSMLDTLGTDLIMDRYP